MSASEVVYGRRCLLQDLAIATDGLLAHGPGAAEMVLDEDVHLQLFCATMEGIFLYGFQGVPEGFFNTPCGYDRFIKELPRFYPDASGAIAAVWGISKLKTANGRGRAFVKFALIEKKLDLYMLALVHNTEHVRTYYMDGALLLASPDATDMIRMVSALRVINFSLFLKDCDTSLENERGNIKNVGVKTGKLLKTDADLIMSECSWCLCRTTHALVSEDMQQLYRCQQCHKLTMICFNHCGAMARCLPQRRLQEAICALCAGDIHGWKAGQPEQPATVTTPKTAIGDAPKRKTRTVRAKTVALYDADGTEQPPPQQQQEPEPVVPAVLSSRVSERTLNVAVDEERILASVIALPAPAEPPAPAAPALPAPVAPPAAPAKTAPRLPEPEREPEPAPAPEPALEPAKEPLAPAAATPPPNEPAEASQPGPQEAQPEEQDGDETDEPIAAQPPTKIFEGMFEVRETDDERTAELKRKLLMRIKAKSEAALSLQRVDDEPEIDAATFQSPVRQSSTPLISTLLGPSPKSPTTPTKDRFKMAAEQEADYAALQSSPTKPSEIVVTRAHWMPDSDTDVCTITGCGDAFTFFKRRHHCRRCGDVVCDKHSRKTLKLNAFAVPDPNGVDSRVCDDCYASHHAKLIAADPVNAAAPGDAPASPARAPAAPTSIARHPSTGSNAEPAFDQVPFHVPTRPKTVSDMCGVCHMPLLKGIVANPRYCEALGIYCCPSCHSGGKTIVPAQVLRNWVFAPMEVCDRMRTFLVSMYDQPFYNIDLLNPGLYTTVPKLRTMKGLRDQLGHLQSFLLTCTAGKPEKLDRVMPFVSTFDPQRYSMRELVELNDGTLIDYVTSVNRELMAHVFECDLCKAKGFICEICRDPKPFYSFQTQISEQCPTCRAFFHSECRRQQDACPRCARRGKK